METNIHYKTCQDSRLSFDKTLRDRFKRQLRLITELSPSTKAGCAFEMGIDPSLISHWYSDATGGKPEMPVWRLIPWTGTYGPELLRWVARQCGYDLVPSGESMFTGSDVHKLVSVFAQESGLVTKDALEGNMNVKDWQRIQCLVNRIVESLEVKNGL